MNSLKFLAFFGALTVAAPNPTLFGRSINIQCNRNQQDVALIRTEVNFASNSAKNAALRFLDKANKDYWEGFMPESLRNVGASFEAQIRSILDKAGVIAREETTDYQISITCDNNTRFCRSGHFAHMNDNTKTMNLCNAWFDEPRIKKTRDAIRDCQSDNPTLTSLKDFRLTKSNIILHEWTHTTFVMSGPKSLDYAYGVDDCLKLAAGTFTRDSTRYPRRNGDPPVCPDPSNPNDEGICDPNFAADNADSLSLISTGIFYSQSCGKHVPIQPPAPASGNLSQTILPRSEAPTPVPSPTAISSPPVIFSPTAISSPPAISSPTTILEIDEPVLSQNDNF